MSDYTDPSWVTESYTPDEGNQLELAQEAYEHGLIFLANQNALHHFGYALGVSVDEDGKVNGLNLHKTDDPDGIWFDEETIVSGRKKLFGEL